MIRKNRSERQRKTKKPCKGCFLHADFCICDETSLIPTQTRLDLIVHHKELKRTTNTGRLIELCLENRKIWVRGQKDQPLDCAEVLDEKYQPLLLYPSDEAVVLNKDSLKVLNKIQKPFQLLVPDGNWRQASKVHYRERAFDHIPRVKLSEGLAEETSLLRKETKINGMSTLESIAHAYAVLEGAQASNHILNLYQMKKLATLKSRGVI